MDPARTGSARTHVPASKPKNRSPKRDDLQIAKRPPRRGLAGTGRDSAMGGRGRARRASTQEGRESPVQADLAGGGTDESESVIRGDSADGPKGRSSVAGGGGISRLGPHRRRHVARVPGPGVRLWRRGRSTTGSAMPGIRARSSLRKTAISGKRHGNCRQRRREES